jgi:hypothetical protein
MEILSIDRSVLKSEAQRFVGNAAHLPSCESPLKIPIRFVQLLAIWILIPIEGMNIHRGV